MHSRTPRDRSAEDLSLIAGGPLYRAMLRMRLVSWDSPLLPRRVAAFVALTWLPLLAITATRGRAMGGQITVPFLEDFVTHARFLLALPLLIMAEPLVGAMLLGVATYFVKAHLVPQEETEGFARAASSMRRLRDSDAVEVLLLALAYLGAYANLRVQLSTSISTWRVAQVEGTPYITMAGWWYVLVSIPLFQFLLYRWAWRFCVWALFLRRVSKLKLRLIAVHPDRTGGARVCGGGAGSIRPRRIPGRRTSVCGGLRQGPP